MTPKCGETWVERSLHIGRIIGHRHQQRDDEGKWEAESDDTIVEKSPYPLALETSPDEEAGDKEKQRHQKNVLPGTKQVEPEPSRAVDDWKCPPEIRGAIERERRAG